MKDTTKRVVILENLSSPYVHQAIIVMREFDPRLESRAVTDAERIVGAYLDNMKLNSKKNAASDQYSIKNGRHDNSVRKNRVLPYFIGIALVLLLVAAVVLRF